MTGIELREWRLQRKLTMRELATLSGVAASTIARFENGRGCSNGNYQKLLDVTNWDKVVSNEDIPLKSKVALYIKEIQVLLEQSED